MTQVQECLANNIKLYRKKNNITQEQLAERVGTSTNYIGTIETGKKFPSPQMIERIANALNIKSLQLFQTNTVFHVHEEIDITSLQKSIMNNIEKAVNKALEKI